VPYPMMLREGQINSMRVRNRIITGPMERAMANRDGTLNKRYIDYLTERARGGAGLINVESAYVDPRGHGNTFQVGCHDDKVIPGLTRLCDAVHAEGAKLSMEIYFAGRQTAPTATFRQPMAATSMECGFFDPAPTPREMTVEEIGEVVRAFADAARRCVAAGVDMIHLHGAHGYLLGGFLSPWSNTRTDEYGGSLENRGRLAIEVLAAVREVVGPDYPIGYRISLDEFLDGGLSPSETIPFCERLVAAGIDLLDVTGGIYESGAMIFQGPERGHGGFVSMASELKRAVGDAVPVSVTQKLNKPDVAEQAMAVEGFDFVSMTRAFHADPHFVRKLEEDRAGDILPCIGCHTCLNLFFGRKVAHCAANPQSTFERTRQVSIAPRPGRVAVVGGGPAGMTAARLLSRQGQHVVLFEATAALGGQLNYAQRVAPDYGYLTTWLTGQLEKLGVDVRLGTPAGPAELTGFDAVVVATGATGGYRYTAPDPGMATFDLFSAMDRPKDEWRDNVVIIGGDAESCYLAMHLAGIGVPVHVVEPGPELAMNKDNPARSILLGFVAENPLIDGRCESTVEEIGARSVTVQRGGEYVSIDNVGAVVYGGRVSSRELYERHDDLFDPTAFFVIGDAVEPRDIHFATQEAAQVAERVAARISENALRADVATSVG
jgi:2,4-dienoyl-CoA reductase-like NADH-dependent reductase (Old Yellow Enzyme family)/thioredoxin reductase